MLSEEIRVGGYVVYKQKRLAEGGFGFIDLVTDKVTSVEYALKRCYIPRPEDFATVNKELQMLQKFKGKFVVKLISSEILESSQGREALILLDYCSGGTLLTRIMDRNPRVDLEMEEIWRFFGQILLGVEVLHTAKPKFIVHRDLKLENILFANDETIRLCDFG